MIRGYVVPKLFGDAFALSLVDHAETNGLTRPMILRLVPDATGDSVRGEWTEFDEHDTVEPTMHLSAREVFALADAIAEIRSGTSEMRALRADYDAERKRVDRLIDTISTVATGGAR